MWGAGLSNRLWGCGSWGEHGVSPGEDPWAIRVCSGVHYVIVPALQDCTRDLRRGPLAVCTRGGEVVIGDAEAGGAEGGVVVGFGGALPFLRSVWAAGWSFSAGACRRWMVPLLVQVSVSCVRAWLHSTGGIQTCLSRVCRRALWRMRFMMVWWTPLSGPLRSRRALMVRAVQLSCRRYQPKGVSTALPWRAAWRSLGSLIIVAVRGGCLGSGGAWRGGLPRSGASTLLCVRSSVGVAGLGGAGGSPGRAAGGSGVSQVLVVRGPCGDLSSGARCWCLGGLWMDMGGGSGLFSRLLHISVTYGMVTDETHHVFPCDRVGGLLRVCQQTAFPMCRLGRRPADRF